MNQFLRTASRWIIPGIVLCFTVWIAPFLLNENADTNGLNRLKPIRCNSMIFGTSRSAQGVNPAILKGRLAESGDWYNFSFNLSSSPWNKAYTRAILSKIQCSISEDFSGHFLLFVDPWSMDGQTGKGENSFMHEAWFNPCSIGYSKLQFILHTTNPLSAIGGGEGTDLFAIVGAVPRRIRTWLESADVRASGVQENGWLPNSKRKTAARVEKDITSKVAFYRKNKHRGDHWPGHSNEEALIFLIEAIKDMDESAKITLVRPPVTNAMHALEQKRFPEINDWMQTFSLAHGIQKIDANEQWDDRSDEQFNDAHHLHVKGANKFSSFLADELSELHN